MGLVGAPAAFNDKWNLAIAICAQTYLLAVHGRLQFLCCHGIIYK